jgi:hypothetical protein
VHKYHKDAIIKSFRNVGLSLLTDGLRDSKLSIQDLLNITVGDWTRALEATAENPIVISNDVGDSSEIDNGYLYTTKEVEKGIKVKEEDKDENVVTTDLGDESNQRFDYNEESDFDDDVDGESDFNDDANGDEDEADENIE